MGSMVTPAREIAARVPARLGGTPPQIAPPSGLPEIELLIARGESSHVAATRRLAGRIRTNLDDLRRCLASEKKEAEALARVAELRQRLDDATAELRRLRNVNPVKAVKAVREPEGPAASVVRAWARAAGVACPDMGRIPVGVAEQYRAAHNGGAS